MNDPEVRRLLAVREPVVSLFLDLSNRVENAAAHLSLRWRDLRERTRADGGAEADLRALDEAVGASPPGDATLAAFAAGGLVVLRRRLDRSVDRSRNGEPAGSDRAVVGLPCVLPLLDHRARTVPYVTVMADRTGAELAAYVDGGRLRWAGERNGSHDEIERNAPGGWSQSRYQHRAEDSWEHNMAEVAGTVTALADDVRAELVVLAGDVRATQYLREHLPSRLRPLVRRLDHAGRHPSGGDERHAAEVGAALDAAARAHHAMRLEEFQRRRAEHERAADGPAATLGALARGQVDTLLVVDDPADQRLARFGARPAAVAPLTPSPAAPDPSDPAGGDAAASVGRLADVAVRAAIGTGATVEVLPLDVRSGPTGGVGAVLRYPTGP
jgi:Bacterial archaeo-eukaryotic release factor family 2